MYGKAPLRVIVAACAALAVASCSESSGPDGTGDARLSIHLTDAPGDVTAAVVTISEVYLQGGPNGRVNLLAAPVTVDLVDLAQATTTLVADADVEPATYAELRFVITGGYVAVDEGGGATGIYASSPTYAGLPAGAVVTGDLQMPSLGQSGLKVNFDSDLVIGGDVDLLVDFDVAQSFGHAAGQSGKWVMHPVINGGRLEAAATVTASIRLAAGVTLPAVGGITLTLGDFEASLAGEALPFTDTDGDGTWTAAFRFVIPGRYQVAVVAPAGLQVVTAPTGPVSVDLQSGESATVDFVVENAIRLP